MTKDIYIFRHGNAVRGEFEPDYGKLIEQGVAQATDLGEKLRGKNIEIIFTSPVERAFNTATIAAANAGNIPIVTNDNLVELPHECRFDEIDERADRAMAEIMASKYKAVGVSSHSTIVQYILHTNGFKVIGIGNCELFHLQFKSNKWNLISPKGRVTR